MSAFPAQSIAVSSAAHVLPSRTLPNIILADLRSATPCEVISLAPYPATVSTVGWPTFPHWASSAILRTPRSDLSSPVGSGPAPLAPPRSAAMPTSHVQVELYIILRTPRKGLPRPANPNKFRATFLVASSRLQRCPCLVIGHPLKFCIPGDHVSRPCGFTFCATRPAAISSAAHALTSIVLSNFAYAEIKFAKPCGLKSCATLAVALSSAAHVLSPGIFSNFAYAQIKV